MRIDTPGNLAPYRAGWRWLFALEKARLWLVLQQQILDIQHVGSTAIPGMVARPIIDISLAVRDYEQAWELVDRLKALGYEYEGENPDLREYSFARRGYITYRLFVVEPANEKFKDRILFRDFLRSHPQTARSYAELKIRLARQHHSDLQAYQWAKLAFVRQVLAQANQN